MLSRHRIACWIFAREGIGRQLFSASQMIRSMPDGAPIRSL
jgi:hypothetical protein